MLEGAGCTFDDVVDVTMFLIQPEASLGFVLEEMKKTYRDPLAECSEQRPLA